MPLKDIAPLVIRMWDEEAKTLALWDLIGVKAGMAEYESRATLRRTLLPIAEAWELRV